MKQLVKRSVLVKSDSESKKQLVKRDKTTSPLTYPEWKALILTGLKNKTGCMYPPDVYFDFGTLTRHKVPKKIVDRFVRKGIIVRATKLRIEYFVLKEKKLVTRKKWYWEKWL